MELFASRMGVDDGSGRLFSPGIPIPLLSGNVSVRLAFLDNTGKQILLRNSKQSLSLSLLPPCPLTVADTVSAPDGRAVLNMYQLVSLDSVGDGMCYGNGGVL